MTGPVLLVLVLKLLAGSLHEFLEARVLTTAAGLDDAVEVFTSPAASWIILGLLVLAPLACLAWGWWRAGLRDAPRPEGVRP